MHSVEVTVAAGEGNKGCTEGEDRLLDPGYHAARQPRAAADLGQRNAALGQSGHPLQQRQRSPADGEDALWQNAKGLATVTAKKAKYDDELGHAMGALAGVVTVAVKVSAVAAEGTGQDARREGC